MEMENEYKKIALKSATNHKKQMNLINLVLPNESKINCIKACTIARTAVKKKFGLNKAIPKNLMTAEQLEFYDQALNLTTSLMLVQNVVKIGHISTLVYEMLKVS